MTRSVAFAQVANVCIIAFLFYGGPPIGDAGLHPWDVLTTASSLVVVVLCPAAYVFIWLKKRWPYFMQAAAATLLALSLLLTAFEAVIYTQRPHVLYSYFGRGCIYAFGKIA